jgi:hypothetical protein
MAIFIMQTFKFCACRDASEPGASGETHGVSLNGRRKMAAKLLRASLVFAGLLGFAAAAYSAEVVVRMAPPRPQSVVVVGRAPGPKYVWIGGYYRWNGTRYVWVAGRWMLPPRAGVVWVAPRWVPRNGGYVFVAGRWR